MNKHTPGPWIKGTLEWVGSNGKKVVVSDGPSFGSKSQWPEAEANALLICAAPDLLEALEYVADIDVSGTDDSVIRFILAAAQHKARSAIARARGEA